MLLVSLLQQQQQQQQEASFLRATVESFLTIPFCSSSDISLLLLRILTHTHIQYTWYTHTVHTVYTYSTHTHTQPQILHTFLSQGIFETLLFGAQCGDVSI